ncbi:MAG: NAD(P)H-dependent oxidoreductase subunit E [Coxiellaceae bacterium]|nr:NAD(P)H-dependent oxidoreductase subunit E [Coxiellaceae bacterium]
MADVEQIVKDSHKEIDHWLAKYPADQRRSAVVAALMIVQEKNGGYLSQELMTAVAEYLRIPPIEAYEAASFYDMYEFKPIGKHKIGVCTNVSCMLNGSEEIVANLEKRLGIKLGETTADGQFTLRETECLAACANAPVCQVNNKDYVEDLTVEKMDALIDKLSAKGGNDGD